MNTALRFAALALLGLSPVAFAQSTQVATPAPGPAAQQQTQKDFDGQISAMQERMKQMQGQMEKIQQTQDPQERQKLLEDHWKSMQAAMAQMNGICCAQGGGMMGGGMMRGGMMGGHSMMWSDYQNLTPEQLKQRQYMMDRMFPIHQMMMNQMIQHQQMMMQAPPTPAKK